MGQSYGFAECAAAECPRPANDRGSFSILKSQMHMDKQGHYWCDLCQRRCELINWAHGHHHPRVRVQGTEMVYAMAGGASDWFMTIAMADEGQISALYETLIEKKRQPLLLNGGNEGVERVKEWLEAFDKATAELPLE